MALSPLLSEPLAVRVADGVRAGRFGGSVTSGRVGTDPVGRSGGIAGEVLGIESHAGRGADLRPDGPDGRDGRHDTGPRRAGRTPAASSSGGGGASGVDSGAATIEALSRLGIRATQCEILAATSG